MIKKPGVMLGGVDVREIAGCTCLKLRRATRRATQLYDAALAPTGLTITQLGILGHLYGGLLKTGGGMSIGELADQLDMDPTTLNRTLKPLETGRLVGSAQGRRDKRVRAVQITAAGQAKLEQATPLWAKAQRSVELSLGAAHAKALNALLDTSIENITIAQKG